MEGEDGKEEERKWWQARVERPLPPPQLQRGTSSDEAHILHPLLSPRADRSLSLEGRREEEELELGKRARSSNNPFLLLFLSFDLCLVADSLRLSTGGRS